MRIAPMLADSGTIESAFIPAIRGKSIPLLPPLPPVKSDARSAAFGRDYSSALSVSRTSSTHAAIASNERPGTTSRIDSIVVGSTIET